MFGRGKGKGKAPADSSDSSPATGAAEPGSSRSASAATAPAAKAAAPTRASRPASSKASAPTAPRVYDADAAEYVPLPEGYSPFIKGHQKLGYYNQQERELANYVRTATKNNVWYYRDRMSVPRGPCPLPVLRECWVHGVIDENTLVWGQGLDDWLPVRNVRTLVPQIRTVEVQLATWVKRTFGLKPALEQARKHRADKRQTQSSQVERMY